MPSHPHFHASVLDAIGNTPLIYLKRASETTGCTILGKAEFMNPGQSVKDRAALFIIRDAEKRGALKPGGMIVEGTAGNTGIGLALEAGYRFQSAYQFDAEPPELEDEDEAKDALPRQGPNLGRLTLSGVKMGIHVTLRF